MKTTAISLIIGIMALFLWGCNDDTAEWENLTLEEVYRSDYCGNSSPTGTIIADEAHWRAITEGGGRLLRDGPNAETNSRFQSLATDSLLVLVAAGQKPSAGYSIRIDTRAGFREGNELVLTVVQGSPPADSMQAAVVTSPCVVIAIGNYHGIEKLRFTGFDSELTIQVPAGS